MVFQFLKLKLAERAAKQHAEFCWRMFQAHGLYFPYALALQDIQKIQCEIVRVKNRPKPIRQPIAPPSLKRVYLAWKLKRAERNARRISEFAGDCFTDHGLYMDYAWAMRHLREIEDRLAQLERRG